MYGATSPGNALTYIRKRGALAIFAFSARALEQFSNLAMIILAARFISPAEFGIFSLANIFIILIQTLIYTGIFQFILTSKHNDDAVISTSFWIIIILTGATSLSLASLAYPLQILFEAPDLALVLVLLALAQPAAALVAWSSATMLRREEVTRNFRFVFLENLAALISGVLLLWYWHSIFALVAARYARVLFGVILFMFGGRTWPRFEFSASLAKKAVTFSSSLYGSRFLAFLSRYAGDLLLGLFHSPAALGLYRFGNRIATGTTDVLTQPISNFAATKLGSAARQDRDLSLLLAEFSGTTALLTGMLGAAIIVFGGDIVSQLFQQSYLPALVVTSAMGLRGITGVGQMLVEPTFSALDRTHWVLIYNLFTAIASIVGIMITAPFGIEFLAWGQIVLVFLSTLWAFHLIRWKGEVQITPALRNFAVSSALVLAFGIAIYALRQGGIAVFNKSASLALTGNLFGAALLALFTILIATYLRAFSLEAFSG